MVTRRRIQAGRTTRLRVGVAFPRPQLCSGRAGRGRVGAAPALARRDSDRASALLGSESAARRYSKFQVLSHDPMMIMIPSHESVNVTSGSGAGLGPAPPARSA